MLHRPSFSALSVGLVALCAISACGAASNVAAGGGAVATNGPAVTSTAPALTPTAQPVATQPASVAPVTDGSALADAGASPAASAPWNASAVRAAAAARVSSMGYQGTLSSTGWDGPGQLAVIVGADPRGDGHRQRAFFFVGGSFIGTDTSTDSADIMAGQSTLSEVPITYGLYANAAPLCCPTGFATVRYHWTGTRLTPLDPIPSLELRR